MTQSDQTDPALATRDVIVKLLRNIGGQREVEQYLKLFAGVDSQRFAVIKVGGGIVEEQLDELASALTFLQRVGLFPIVVHGAGPQLDAALEREGVETSRVDGMRVTSPRVLEIARRTFLRVNHQLVEALESLGTRARPIVGGVFDAEPLDEERLGLVGSIKRVHMDAIESSIRSRHLPIVACLGETSSGQILNVNADLAARELTLEVQPYKIVFLTPTGGLLDRFGRVISAINITEDYDDLLGQPWVSGGMRLKLQEVKQLLDALPETSSVSITSPALLAKELFTYMGSGTLVRRGEVVRAFESFEDVDQGRLRYLLELCFGQSLDETYFESKSCFRVYLTDSYRATAILTREGAVPYLDKFAVTREAQGAGMGSALWGRIRREHPKLFWRARAGNPINTWYFQNAQGSYRTEEWVVFWYGLADFDEVQACVHRALSLPPTLRAHGTVEA